MAMSMKRQFVWTLVPAGRITPINGVPTAVCSLLLTPRLFGPVDTALRLKDFGLENWPQRLGAVSLSALRGTASVGLSRVPYTGIDGTQHQFTSAEQLSAWQALFGPDTPVAPRPTEPISYRDRNHIEFPASQAGTQVSAAYGQSTRVLATADHSDHVAMRTALSAANNSWRAGLSAPAGAVGDAALDPSAAGTSPLQQAYEFYRRPPTQSSSAPRTDDADTDEFHYVLSRLADHPILLRALGLLVDLAFPVTALQGSGPGTLQIAVGWPDPDPAAPPGWAAAVQEDLTPTTAYTLAGPRFVPAGTTGTLAAPYALGMLAVANAGPAGEGTNGRFEIMPFDVDGAALRMVGSAASGEGQPISGHADDPELPALRSAGFALVDTDRMTEHTNRIARADDRSTPDGLLGSPLTAENLISGYRVDILDTATQQWRSLCQRRVRYSIGDIQVGADTPVLDEGCVRVDSVTADGDDSLYVHQAIARWDGWSLVASRPDRIADPIDIPELPFTVHVSHDPGSLPRLRFGRTYQLRVRLSDTAGGGLHVQEPQLDEQCSAEFIHRRFEPIPPPEMLPTRPYVDGEGQGQLVIRSDRGTSTADYAAAHPAYHPDDLRYLFAPKASLELAIQHGNFDAALGASGAPTADTAFQTAVRADRDISDIVGAQPHGAADDPARYYMVPPTGADLPWLPDPGAPLFAVGVRSRPIDPNTGVEGTASGFDDEHQLHIPHRWGQWPGYAPTGLQLVAGTTGCVASMSGSGTPRTLTIALGPAEQATLDVVSCPAQNDVPALGVALWAGMAANDPADPIFQRVEHGHIRTVTPPHTITVVHAVQRPLVDPAGRFVANRQRDDTDAVLRTTDFTFDVASTGRIDVDATWSDLDDVVTDPPSAPATTTYTTQVGSYDVAHVEADNALPIITQQFGDTRRRRVTHSVTAISRFRDFFGALTAADPDACTVRAVLAPVTDVPSSARAPAPHVRYVVPAFGWSRTRGSDGVFRSTRRGGGLRVLLERPWFASGVEEKLAVIISAGPPGPHVSVAGQDPSWTTSSPQTPLDTTHVVAPGRAPAEPLDEADMSVTPMLYPVAFDDELNCWLADLDLSPLADESYFPFVRLSLCRYQENHIIDVPALSPPVQTEPVQLFPTRNLTVTPTAGHVAAILTGLGPTGARPNNVRAELQIADPGVVSDDAVIGTPGWTTIAASDGSLGQQLQLQLPGSAAGSLRVLVTETENYPSPSPAPNTASGRLIYAEAANLT